MGLSTHGIPQDGYYFNRGTPRRFRCGPLYPRDSSSGRDSLDRGIPRDCFFGGHHGWRSSCGSFVRGGKLLTLRMGIIIVPCSVCMVRQPRGGFRRVPIVVSGSSHISYETPPLKRCLVGCRSAFIRLAEHLAFRFALGASNVCCLVGENPTCAVPAS